MFNFFIIVNDNFDVQDKWFSNDNLCISGVFGWDFNLITSNVFVTYVRQFNFLSLENRNWFSALSPFGAVVSFLVGVICLSDASVYCACLSAEA